MDINFLLENFSKVFRKEWSNNNGGIYFAPGRVNLIGEHTDYTGGYVLPFAIDCGTYIVCQKNNTKKFRLFSLNFNDGITEIDPENIDKQNHWSDYFKGVLIELKRKFDINDTFDAIIYGNIPNGSGLSSSASFELVSEISLLDTNGYEIPDNGTNEMVDLALIGQKAENNFVGVNCGIMDQFAIANGKKDKVIFLDCETLDFKYEKFILKDIEILITNSNKKRQLNESKYNERRKECEDGFELLKKAGINKSCLGKISKKEFENIKDKIENTIIKKRLEHIIYENNRVLEMINALSKNDINTISNLINQSHDSLSKNYEVTGFHLDTLVEITRSCDGVLASRMTGAGFGGCTLSLVKSEKLESTKNRIFNLYKEKTQIEPTFYTFKINDGAKKIDI